MNNNNQSNMVADDRLAELAVEDDLYNYPPTQAELNSISAELQEYRKASRELVGIFAKRAGTWLELCPGDAFEHPDAVKLYTAPQPLTDAERAELQEYRRASHEPVVTQFRQVADLYEMQFDDGHTCAFHTDGAKAVQWLNTCDGNKVQEYIKLERLQEALTGVQAVIVPDAIEPDYEVIKRILPTSNPDEYACCIAADMWNACRAAMLAAAPQLLSEAERAERQEYKNDQ